MDLKNKILFALTKKILERNKRFYNIHLGETCYLFGNGASLKTMDLEKFSDKIAIGCNHLVLHKDFNKLNCKYYTIAEPFFFYPIYRNPYSKKIEIHYAYQHFKKAFKNEKNILIFTNVSSYFGSMDKNYFYFYHFGNREANPKLVDLTASFSFLKNALFSMLGLAIYMGFKKAILVGCDNTFFPCNANHFYSKSFKYKEEDYQELPYNPFDEISKLIKLVTITENGSRSDLMNFVEYTDFTGAQPAWKDNHELVNPEYLQILRKAYFAGQYTNPID